MDDVIFVSVAFGNEYVQQQHRLKDSIRSIYPKANLLFYLNELPPGSKEFRDSLYGFKPHAIKHAKTIGFTKIIWLDPAMLLVGKIDKLMNFKFIAVRDDSKLSQCISDKYLSYTGHTRAGVEERGWHLVGGSFLLFDFSSATTHSIFNSWFMDEKAGLFGSQQEAASEQINSHRYDETCMAMAIYTNGLTPQTPEEVGYCIGENAIFQKKHFK
jgi:hypothetical protein